MVPADAPSADPRDSGSHRRLSVQRFGTAALFYPAFQSPSRLLGAAGLFRRHRPAISALPRLGQSLAPAVQNLHVPVPFPSVRQGTSCPAQAARGSAPPDRFMIAFSRRSLKRSQTTEPENEDNQKKKRDG